MSEPPLFDEIFLSERETPVIYDSVALRKYFGPPDELFSSDFEPACLSDQLPCAAKCVTFPSATPVKRKGKSMSRRTGQSGHIEKSGKWWVVRWWMDVPGKEAREHKRSKICPISGPGSLSASERKRRAREIIASSGADTVEHFNKVVKQKSCTTFRSKAVAGSTRCKPENESQLRRARWMIGSAATRDNMGHSTVDVTQNIYTGTWWEQRAEAVRAIGKLIWGGVGLDQVNGSGSKDVNPRPLPGCS